MPIIDYRYPEGLYTAQEQDYVAEQLTDCLMRCDVTRGNPKAKEINWCYLHEMPPGKLYVGGDSHISPHHRVDVFVIKGAMSEPVKEQVVHDMTEAVLFAEGQAASSRNASRVWVLIHEVEDGNWGAAGQIYRLQELMGWLSS